MKIVTNMDLNEATVTKFLFFVFVLSSSYNYFQCVLVYFGTNNPSKGTMAPKWQVVYTKRQKSKSTTLTLRVIDEGKDSERDPTYIPPGTRESPTAPRATSGTL